jgi:hypothetical protein
MTYEPRDPAPVSGEVDAEDEVGDPVQEADEQSFPASDPPSAWSGGSWRPPRT